MNTAEPPTMPPSPHPERRRRTRSKTLATWSALAGGAVGLHRFYLHGFADAWGWVHVAGAVLGAWGLRRVEAFGQDDRLAWLLLPVLGFTLAAAMLQAILIGLTPDARWHERHNPHLPAEARSVSGWLAVIGVAVALLIGATALMATIAFSGQRYFELQIEEARKLSQ